MNRAHALDVVGTLARFGLAAAWLVSGLIKALEPIETTVAVDAYEVLPDAGVEVVAAVLPWLEIAVGVLLLVGVGTRLVAGLSAALLLVFIIGVVQAWTRGLSIDCGFFGGGGAVAPGETAYLAEVARDTGLLLLAGWLLVRPRTLFALDAHLAGSPAGTGRDEKSDGWSSAQRTAAQAGRGGPAAGSGWDHPARSAAEAVAGGDRRGRPRVGGADRGRGAADPR